MGDNDLRESLQDIVDELESERSYAHAETLANLKYAFEEAAETQARDGKRGKFGMYLCRAVDSAVSASTLGHAIDKLTDLLKDCEG